MHYDPQQIETSIIQCSQQCSKEGSLRNLILHSLQVGSWSEDHNGSFQKRFILVASFLVQMINSLRVCPVCLPDEINTNESILGFGLRKKPFCDRFSRYDPRPANGVDNSSSNDNTLLAQLILLADSGFYFHLSRLVNSPEKYQYIQVLFIHDVLCGVNCAVYRQALPKKLGLPNLVSHADIDEFVSTLYTPHYHLNHDLFTLVVYFEDFQRDPARSGGFYHAPPTWHAFAATRFLRFLASSQ